MFGARDIKQVRRLIPRTCGIIGRGIPIYVLGTPARLRVAALTRKRHKVNEMS